ncbi:uncharacterized protein LOC118791871 [Megalops cyprinoides]|uniref:uncharacterized protein LOC118791871 n=1 Tax=Megalops cyprinoides TaxID=118141 RepID=UPI00186531F7|nr:uncharacterized protein LOC118791871 [Megalops cyprinoides]
MKHSTPHVCARCETPCRWRRVTARFGRGSFVHLSVGVRVQTLSHLRLFHLFVLHHFAVCECRLRSRVLGWSLSDPDIPITPPKLQLLPPSPLEVRNKRTVTLVCVATEFYPDHISVSWQQNRVAIRKGSGTDYATLQGESTKTYSISSRLWVPARTWLNPKNSFTCVTSLFNGTRYLTNEEPVNGEEKLNGEKHPTLECDKS